MLFAAMALPLLAGAPAGAQPVDTPVQVAEVTTTLTGQLLAPYDLSGTLVLAYAPTDGFVPTAMAVVTADTATSGSYAMPWLPSGTYKLAYIPPAASGQPVQWAGGVASRTHADTLVVDAAGGPVVAPTQQLSSAAAASGAITDEFGFPVGSVEVWAFPVGQSWVPSATALSRIDGTWAIHDLAPGDYEFYIRPPVLSGYATQWYSGTTKRSLATVVPITQGSWSQDIDATLVTAP